MKKLICGMAAFGLLFTSCENDQSPNLAQETQIDMSDFYVFTDADIEETGRSGKDAKSCYTMVNLNRDLNENPGLEQKMYAIELHTRTHIETKGKPGSGEKPGGGGKPGGSGDEDVDVAVVPDNFGIIEIPVNIIVVYPNSNSISNAQIQSQIAILNADFRNPNINQLPNGTNFANDATDAGFHFSIASVQRHDDPRTSWGTSNAVKAAYPPSSPSTHLNIWVCPIGGGILGYAQFPGGNSATDGIVVDGNYFGNTSGPYGSGRTATHEVGHYLNLRHIWGDGRCRQDDFVLDTPESDRSNGGCPSFPLVHCNTADMTMNYMDYTYDACMYMFTDGQRNRMRAIFAPGGPRASMIVN